MIDKKDVYANLSSLMEDYILHINHKKQNTTSH